jgi:hypothetical protein
MGIAKSVVAVTAVSAALLLMVTGSSRGGALSNGTAGYSNSSEASPMKSLDLPTDISTELGSVERVQATCGPGGYQCGYGDNFVCCSTYDVCCQYPNSPQYYCKAQGSSCN